MVGGERITAARAQRDQRRLRLGVARLELQDAQVERLGALVAPRAHIDGPQAEERIAVIGLIVQRLLVFLARAGEIARHVSGVAGLNAGVDLR